MQKYSYSHGFLMIFKNDVFSKEGSKGGGFRAWGSLGPPWEACRRALWVPGGSRNHGFVFFWRQGGLPGAAKVCTLAKKDYKTQCILMIPVFALSALGGVPGR